MFVSAPGLITCDKADETASLSYTGKGCDVDIVICGPKRTNETIAYVARLFLFLLFLAYTVQLSML